MSKIIVNVLSEAEIMELVVNERHDILSYEEIIEEYCPFDVGIRAIDNFCDGKCAKCWEEARNVYNGE